MDAGKKYSLGEFVLETDKRLLTWNGEPVRLAHRPFQVLLHLVENRERLVARRELLDQFWEGRDVYDMTLSRCVSSIRKALNDQSDHPRFIETRWAEGYRFIGPVEEQTNQPDSSLWEIERVRGVKIVVEDDEEEAVALLPGERHLAIAAAPSIRDLGVPQATQLESARSTQPKRVSKVTIIALASLLIVLTMGGIWFYRHRASAAPAPTESIHSVAVMPLKNLSGDPTNEYFSDGLTESLITALSKIENLKVISRSSVFRFKNRELPPEEIGKALGVAALLEGGVRNVGNSVRVDLRLVSVEDGHVLWTSDEHDHALGDLFALQDKIARDVALALKLRLKGETERQIARRYTDNVEAYQLYLQGRFYLNNLNSDQELMRAIQYFEAAAAKDPNYALAYCGLADSYVSLGIDWRNPTEVMPKAQEYARKALALDDTLGEAHYSRGAVAYFYEWNWNEAKVELDRALDLNAKSLDVNFCYLHALGPAGQPDDALVHVRRALDQNPLSIYVSGELGCASYYAHRYDQALDFSQETLRIDRNYMFAHYNAARALGQKQMYEQAISELNKASEIAGRTTLILSELGYDYAASGRKEEARRLLNELESRSRSEFVDPYGLAFIYIGLGEHDKAMASLEKAYDARSTSLPWIKVEPKFDALHTQGRFQELLHRLNL